MGTDLQDVIGVVSARALLLALLRGELLNLAHLAKAPIFVPESISGRDTLERFREGRTNMAFVVDEYGSLQGLVTLHERRPRRSRDSSVPTRRTGGPFGARMDRGCWMARFR